MAGRLRFRSRMALMWGVGFFVLGATLVAVLAFFFRQSLVDDQGDAMRRIVADLGLEVGPMGELTLSDAAGDSVNVARLVPIAEDIVAGTRDDVTATLLLLLPALAVVAGLVGWWLAGRATRPIVSMTATARQVSSERLDARIDHEGPPDELRDLADAFDGMMDRLEHAFRAQERFAAAASHELRTPLTLIRTELDVAFDTPEPSRAELDAMAESIRYAVGRSEQVIDGLLTLARSGIVEPTETADVSELVEHALEDSAAVIGDHDVSVRTSIETGASIRCDRALVEHMLRNLIDNAAIHNEPGGWIEIATEASEARAIIRVTNGGPELSEITVERMGEAFYRAPVRTREAPGSGLGLAITRSIAEAHGGRLDLDARPGGGLVATIDLPTIRGAG